MKPSIFKIKDFLSFGIISIVSIIGTILVFAMISPIQQAHFLMLLVSLAFIGIYVRFVFLRKAELAPYTWVKTKYFGLMIDFGDYKGAYLEEIVQECEFITEKWIGFFGSKNDIHKIDNVWVNFKQIPFSLPGQKKRKLAGAAVYYTTEMYAGFNDKNDPISKTSFSHELGHILQAYISGEWDEKSHHERSAEANLP